MSHAALFQQLTQNKHKLARVIHNNFPRNNLVLSIGYGSGVFRQQAAAAASAKPKMIDLILVVDDSYLFHRENMHQNPEHYSTLMRFAGAERAAWLQKHAGAHIYYHPFVTLRNDEPSQEYKYGIIDLQDLIQDLEDWTTLYCAGRMQKPVLFIEGNAGLQHTATAEGFPSESRPATLDLESGITSKEYEWFSDDNKISRMELRVAEAQRRNLQGALFSALLLLPEKFTSEQLYETITSLSYMGDVRMKTGGLGEDRNKVSNIVTHNKPFFDRLYLPLLQQRSKGIAATQGPSLPQISAADMNFWQQDLSAASRQDMLHQLPVNMQMHIARNLSRKDTPLRDIDERAELIDQFARSASLDKQREIIGKALHDIVHATSFAQSAKGVLTAGVSKSIRYAREKLEKALASRGSKN